MLHINREGERRVQAGEFLMQRQDCCSGRSDGGHKSARAKQPEAQPERQLQVSRNKNKTYKRRINIFIKNLKLKLKLDFKDFKNVFHLSLIKLYYQFDKIDIN